MHEFFKQFFTADSLKGFVIERRVVSVSRGKKNLLGRCKSIKVDTHELVFRSWLGKGREQTALMIFVVSTMINMHGKKTP
ncbi:hypothetical protein V6R21_20205 [Limibacter armeniacum]|uniref:hypothetical protein n=1 Tax=Limibacter armeniacum TaxID=466084 RepID=UPI002FE64C15